MRNTYVWYQPWALTYCEEKVLGWIPYLNLDGDGMNSFREIIWIPLTNKQSSFYMSSRGAKGITINLNNSKCDRSRGESKEPAIITKAEYTTFVSELKNYHKSLCLWIELGEQMESVCWITVCFAKRFSLSHFVLKRFSTCFKALASCFKLLKLFYSQAQTMRVWDIEFPWPYPLPQIIIIWLETHKDWNV